MEKLEKQTCSRLEIVDHTSTGEGRAYSKRGNLEIEFSLQDDNQTLKVFITEDYGKSNTIDRK